MKRISKLADFESLSSEEQIHLVGALSPINQNVLSSYNDTSNNNDHSDHNDNSNHDDSSNNNDGNQTGSTITIRPF